MLRVLILWIHIEIMQGEKVAMVVVKVVMTQILLILRVVITVQVKNILELISFARNISDKLIK